MPLLLPLPSPPLLSLPSLSAYTIIVHHYCPIAVVQSHTQMPLPLSSALLPSAAAAASLPLPSPSPSLSPLPLPLPLPLPSPLPSLSTSLSPPSPLSPSLSTLLCQNCFVIIVIVVLLGRKLEELDQIRPQRHCPWHANGAPTLGLAARGLAVSTQGHYVPDVVLLEILSWSLSNGSWS
jgi:hypothetical protein